MGVFAKVPRVGQGTWQIEGDRKKAVRALKRGFELGLTHVDTAEMYGSGKAEQIVAEAIAGMRDEVFIVSKVLPNHASYQGTKKACEASLKRIGIDRLDVYLLHWREDEPLEETIRAFEELKKEGKIAAWGVSNFDVRDLEEAEEIAGRGKIACNQVLYNLWTRTIEHRVLPWCEEHGVAVVAYSPFAQRDRLKHDARQGAALAEIAEAHGVSESAVALRFLIDRGTWVIPKATRIEHVEQNAEALSFELTEPELDRLGRAFPKGRSGPVPML
jgi:diketogulonate reductase-like aldo/keto reductase